jgi:polar amino acid transport system substrate-binding protein
MRKPLWMALLGLMMISSASAQSPVSAELAPHGELRVAMIGVNPVLVKRNPDGTLSGISMDLGTFIAGKLHVRLVPVVYASPETYTHSFGRGEWDIAIGPRRPADADKVDFSPEFMLVDNIYVEAPGRNFANGFQVDEPGIKVGVARDGAPDKFLTKALKSAKIVRLPGQVSDGVDALRNGKIDVYGSNGEFVYAIIAKLPGAKVVPGAFTTVHMAILLPKGRSPEARSALFESVKEAIASGLVIRTIEQEKLKGVRPAPG